MGLFSSDKKPSHSSKKIRPTVVRTQNVAKELMSKTKEWLSEASSHPQAGAKPKNPEINYIG